MITKCPACKKEHDVLWPDLWAYKRRNGSNVFYYCSWKCLRTLDKKGEVKHMGAKRLLTEEQEKHAIWLAISGEDPRPYLAECGTKDPQQAWNRLRNNLKASDPETFEKLPKVIGHKKRKKKEPEKTAGDAMEDMQKAADEFFGACEDMGLKLDGEPKICKPVNYDGFEFGAAISTETGFRYEWSQEYNWFCIKANGDEMTLCLEDLRKLMRELPKAAQVLGVEL